MAKIETAIIDQHNAKPLSSADATAGYPYKNMAIIEKIESAWGAIGRGLLSLFPLPIDIAHINFTLRYLQLYLLFSCIAEARFCLFPGRKILVLLHQFGQHIVEKDVVLERTVYVINLSK